MTFSTLVLASAIGTLAGLGALSIFVFVLGYALKAYQRKKITTLMKGAHND